MPTTPIATMKVKKTNKKTKHPTSSVSVAMIDGVVGGRSSGHPPPSPVRCLCVLRVDLSRITAVNGLLSNLI